MCKEYFIHETSIVDEGAIIGIKTKIWHFSHISKNTKIGDNCILGQNIYIAPNVIIGDNVKIQNNVSIYEGVFIEDDVFIGPSVVFTNIINPRSFIERKSEYKNTIIKKGASIGANVTIICGVSIGKYSMVGAGSVVTRNVNSYSLVYGVPSVVKGMVDEYGNKVCGL